MNHNRNLKWITTGEWLYVNKKIVCACGKDVNFKREIFLSESLSVFSLPGQKYVTIFTKSY
jgi:hypothetical protein